MWEQHSNPVIRRPCEIEAKKLIDGLDPNPTMGLGIITARAVAFVRKLENRGTPPSSIVRQEIIEVYPAATLRRLAERDPRFIAASGGKLTYDERAQALDGFADLIDDLEAARPELKSKEDHAFDALVTTYTGWLHPDGLERPPEGFNVASGWIWVPTA